MRIGVIADTHGDLHALEKAKLHFVGMDAIIHAGDYGRDARYLEGLGCPVYVVAGNHDRDAPEEIVIDLGGKRIWITHGNQYDVYYTMDRLIWRALEKQADIVIFGHTHRPLAKYREGIWLMNPGSASTPRMGSSKSIGFIDVDLPRITLRHEDLV